MTAGQRNCFIEIEECLKRYTLDDVLFAVQEHITLLAARQHADSGERRICKRVANDILNSRGWIAGIK
jgi:hypothetical protein